MFSLFEFLKKRLAGFRKFARVSPPLVGVVLLLTLAFPFDVYAASGSTFRSPTNGYYSFDGGGFSGLVGTIPYYVGTIRVPVEYSFFANGLTDEVHSSMMKGTRILTFDVGDDGAYILTSISVSDFKITDYYGNDVGIKSYFPKVVSDNGGTVTLTFDPEFRFPAQATDDDNYRLWTCTFVAEMSVYCSGITIAPPKIYVAMVQSLGEDFKWYLSSDLPSNPVYSDADRLESIDQNGKGQLAQDKQYHDEEIEAGNQSGSDAENLVSELDTVKSKWEILWYPITFTNNLYAAVTGGGAAYSARSGGIIGYEYDNDVGELVPVYSRTRDAPATSGTVLTFPAFTLPVLNVQVWDSYSFDLASVKDQFPMVFDAIYVIFTVVEVVWFVKFLQKKFHEVFG